MALEKIFIEKGKKRVLLEDFLEEKFKRGGYSHSEIERTPLGTRIIIYLEKPNLFIGRRKFLQKLSDEIKENFGLENPIFDLREVENPFLDAQIVANRIARVT